MDIFSLFLLIIFFAFTGICYRRWSDELVDKFCINTLRAKVKGSYNFDIKKILQFSTEARQVGWYHLDAFCAVFRIRDILVWIRIHASD